MSAELVVRPGFEVPSLDDFISSHPPYSIALDGYVVGPPEFKRAPDGPYANLDHHWGVPRLDTLSTAQQMLRKLRMGLAEAFNTPEGEYRPTAYVNDSDQDVSLSWWLVAHGEEVARQRYEETPLDRLVEVAGTLDATAGAYPNNPDDEITRRISWIFRPYTNARKRGELQPPTPGTPNAAELHAAAHREVIFACAGRIGLHLAGKSQEIPLDTRYKIIGGDGERWTMFTEIGEEGRIGALRDRIKAYVICNGERADGNFDYTIGRVSEFVPFDVDGIVRMLNQIENCPPTAGWGCAGTGTIGGSPRIAGSRLDPTTLNQRINEYLQAQRPA